MVDMSYFQKQATGDLMKIVLILLNVPWKMLALAEKMQNSLLLNFIKENARKGIMVLFVIFVILGMEK